MDCGSSLSQQSDRFHKTKSSVKQLELHVASVYTQIAQMIQKNSDLQIQMPNEVSTAVQRVNLIKSVLLYLLEQTNLQQLKKSRNQIDGENKLACMDCQNYQKNLQKLQGQVRNHIRTHQQLKLYQDGLQQKIQQFKKERKQLDRKFDNLKRKYQQLKTSSTLQISQSQKILKLEQQNDKMKNEIKQLKSICKIEEPKKQMIRYESNKQNFSQWRNSNIIEKQQRSSIEKRLERPESTQRMRVSVNVRSTKGIPISSKIVQEKSKILKNRIGF